MTSSPIDPPPDSTDNEETAEKANVSLSALDALARRLAEVEETMRREHERAAHRERVIDRLHAENQELRHGLLEEALTPVRAGLYRLYDNTRRQAARWRAEPPSGEHAASLLEALADELGEILGRAGAERLPVQPGDAYDPVIHRPVRTAPVAPEADGTVVEVLADGFAGVAIPVALDRMDQDPAVASSVFVTTVTDSMGFLAFLGLAVASGLVG